MPRPLGKIVLLLGILLSTGLSGCSSPANREAMTPQNLVVSKQYPYSVRVKTSGGMETGAMDSSNISDADLKLAIEDAISQSKLFKSIVQGSDGNYELSVRVVSLSKPVFGTTFTVDMEGAWSMIKVSDKSVVLRKSIKSSGTATMGDAFAAVTRLRLAVESAAKDNIAQGLKAIGELNL